MYLFLIISITVLSVIVQQTLQSRFAKYSRVHNSNGMTGAQIAELMLRNNGINDVRVVSVEGRLTDHYNPMNKTVNLSRDVYNGTSVAAAAVAAHECGHVLQHASGYAPLKLRTALVPVVNFAGSLVSWVIIAGLVLINVFPNLIWFGIALMAVSTLFSIVTLPVEVNASKRAIDWVTGNGIVNAQTRPMAVDALKWAAYTYVVAALGSIATLLYYIGLARRD